MTHQLKHAYTARLNRAIKTAQNIIVVLDGIKNKRRTIDSMADARGLLGHLSQEIHEASDLPAGANIHKYIKSAIEGGS